MYTINKQILETGLNGTVRYFTKEEIDVYFIRNES